MKRTYVYDLRVKEDAIPYLKKVSSTTKANDYELRSPVNIVKTMINVFDCDKLIEEHVWILCLDNKHHAVGFFEISHGTENASCLSTAAIFRRALLSSASRIVLVHNHPSGDCSPSTEDVNVTKKVIEAGKYLDINLLDHIIIGRNGSYLSFYETYTHLFK